MPGLSVPRSVGLAFSLVAAVGIGSSCATGDKPPDTTDDAVAISTAPAARYDHIPDGWNVFEAGGASLALPPGFEDIDLALGVEQALDGLRELGPEFDDLIELVENNPDLYVMLAVDTSGEHEGANVVVTSEYAPGFTLTTYNEQVQSLLPDTIEVVSTEFFRLTDYETMRLLLRIGSDDAAVNQLVYVIQDGSTFWGVAYTGPEEEFTRLTPMFQQSARSFSAE